MVAETLAKTVAWVKDDLGLTLRAALVPVSVVREKGFDVLVQTTQVSEAVNNFAFRGGGISYAEKLMKAGQYAVAPAPPGSRPDLAGLSCRWSPISSEGQKIVSIIIEAGRNAEAVFAERAEKLLGTGRHGRTPVRLADTEARLERFMAAGGPRARSEGDARHGLAAFAQAAPLRGHAVCLGPVQDRHAGRRFRSEALQGIYISQHRL